MTVAVGGTNEHFEVPLVPDPYRVKEKPPAKRVDDYYQAVYFVLPAYLE